MLAHKTLGHFAVLVTSAGVFTAIDFTHTITLGSIVVTFVVAVVAGVFTIRSRIANIWRQEAEGERAAKERLDEELAAEKESRARFEREQQELRHGLKNKIAELKAEREVLAARTDLTVALDAIQKINEQTSESIIDAFRSGGDRSRERDETTHRLLTEIRDKLPAEPVAVRGIAIDE